MTNRAAFILKRGAGFLILVAALMVASSGRASASSIVPDLSIQPLDVSWDGTTFSASGSGSLLSLYDGTNTALSLGNAAISWSSSTNTGTFQVDDALGWLTGTAGTMLSGSVTNFLANILNPGPGASFTLTAALTTSLLQQGDLVTIAIGSTDFSVRDGIGTGQADVFSAVPEPGTVGLLGIGLAALLIATRARASRMSS